MVILGRRKCLHIWKKLYYVTIFCLVFLVVNVIYRRMTGFMPERPVEQVNRNFDKYVTMYGDNMWKNTSKKNILLWTPFFGSWDILDEIRGELAQCSAKCSVTADTSELETSNAVLFHANDLWPYSGLLGTIFKSTIELPTFRRPAQVWAIFSKEPIVYMWGNIPPNIFNWTIMYRREATIYAPFSDGYSFNKDIQNQHEKQKGTDFFKDKTKFASTLVSNCQDQAKRYRIINELKKYIEIDDFGKCSGQHICPVGMPTYDCGVQFLAKYKFYLAFENSYCRDYLSEKFWNALGRRQIPVIATPKYNTELLPPKSYLNVFDFHSIKDLADKMIEIGNNRTLYNSYFDWIATYKVDMTSWHCKFCIALHSNLTARSYTDMEAWIKDDMCSKSGPWSLITGFFDRLLFDLGIG